jgi:predicted GNAT family acetyltransferase
MIEYKLEQQRVAAYKNGEEVGEMTFKDMEDFYIIDHTGVSNTVQGEGVGKNLVSTLVEHARSNGLKILPLCPFAKAEFKKNEAYHDVLQTT